MRTIGWVRLVCALLIGLPFLCAAPVSDFLRISQFDPISRTFEQVFLDFRTEAGDQDTASALIDTHSLVFRLIGGITLPIDKSVVIGETDQLASDIVRLRAAVSPADSTQMIYSITLQSDAVDTLGNGNRAFQESTILGNQVFDLSTALFGRGTEGQFPLRIEVYSCGFETAEQGTCLDTASIPEPSTAMLVLGGFALIAACASLAGTRR